MEALRSGSGNPDGRIADNIVYFARALRKAGMRVGPASVMDAIEAVLASGIGSRDDFYWTLHAVLVSRHEDHATFDEAFRLFWKSRELIEKMLAMFSPVAPDQREKQKPRTAENRVSQAMFEGHQKSQPPHHRSRNGDGARALECAVADAVRRVDHAGTLSGP